MSHSGSTFQTPTVAIVGGGLAGMAAAVALARRGLRVELFEAARRLGGRAGSFRDSETGEQIDYCQHVSMGCCTNLAELCRTTGIDDCFARHRRLHFFGPDGQRRDFAASRWLPAPLHLGPALLRLGYLTLGERIGISRAMLRLARCPVDRNERDTTVGDWLREQGQSPRAIERFWSPVLLGALSETLDRASLRAARKVFLDGFLSARRAYEVEVPVVPLEEIFGRRLADWLAAAGVAVHLGTGVQRVEGDARAVRELILADGTRRPFGAAVVAVPWHKIRELLAPALLDAVAGLKKVERIEPAAITAVHLWFDRPITRLPHAVLVGRMSQWLFSPEYGSAESCMVGQSRRRPALHYHQVVISASHTVAIEDRGELASRVVAELASIWPAAREAELLHHRVVTNRRAVFSARPGLDTLRPVQQTPVANLALAGDWTATGWPATMEGAVRSGHLAAETVLRWQGRDERVMVPDLPRSRLARWLFGRA